MRKNQIHPSTTMIFKSHPYIKSTVALTGILVLTFFLLGVFNPTQTLIIKQRIDRPPTVVFATYTNPEMMVRRIKNLLEVELISGEPNEVGSVYEFRVSGKKQNYVITEELTEFIRDQRIAYQLKSEAMTVDAEINFIPENGGTLVVATHHVTGKGDFWKAYFNFFHSLLEKKLKEDYLNLKQLAEEVEIKEKRNNKEDK
ncbi:SRPBCC family protein [Xanthovirga aplysinae]|uniref:SRPBCC family protein n=1 Tax=Xanthovirga aplysinae TaxID=2529853 RepID=UPI0012BBDEE1|nr:SRPBCC family protein [Xanthovirga aplysinae]MTI31765.1 SRPBCC family protein [Xanthovirga aplysinae]